MTNEQRRERIEEIDRLIGEAVCWGAYVGALEEERRGLARALEREPS